MIDSYFNSTAFCFALRPKLDQPSSLSPDFLFASWTCS
jgi:hypothetical protein